MQKLPTQTIKSTERPLHDYVTEISEQTDVQVGVPLPMGTNARNEGVNFALFSRYASRVRLELFDHSGDAKAARVFDLDPVKNRTGDIWHIWIKGIRPGQMYAYRVDGPYQPPNGLRFNFNKILLEPFATAISRLPTWEFAPALGYEAIDTSHETLQDLLTETYHLNSQSSAIFITKCTVSKETK